MSKFEEYRDKYQYIRMDRRDGILQMTFHSKGKELLWGGRPHEEASYAFYEVARDRENKAVIITGTGNSFCADIIWGRANENTPAVTKARPLASDHTLSDAYYLIMNHLNIAVPTHRGRERPRAHPFRTGAALRHRVGRRTCGVPGLAAFSQRLGAGRWRTCRLSIAVGYKSGPLFSIHG